MQMPRRVSRNNAINNWQDLRRPSLRARKYDEARSRQSAPKDWADSCLAAFALAAQLTLATFDQSFSNRARSLVLAKP
jgi:predicted nucleic acid-binding protein